MSDLQHTVSAVVVTWNSSQDIESCLASLSSQTRTLKEIVVVDNASKDDTTDLVRDHFPDVILIEQTENVGFAKGNNIGISECNADWILTLNPDATIEPDWVEKLLEFCGSNSKIGALTGKLLRRVGEETTKTIDSAGIEIYKSRRVKDRGFGEPEHGQYDTAEPVFGACAAAALYRTEMLRDIAIDNEIFPERFFCYYEDADLAWRSWRRGWQTWYQPQATGWHRRGGSPIGSRFSRFMTHRNRLWLLARNEPSNISLLFIPAIMLHELLMLLRTVRYPYLLKAIYESCRGYSISRLEGRQLESKNPDPPPMKRGIGFSG